MTFIILFIAVFFFLWAVFMVLTPQLLRGLAFIANRTAKIRYSDYLPVVILLILTTVATAAAGDAFLDLAEQVSAGSTVLKTIDGAVNTWAATKRSSTATLFFVAVTQIGSPVGLGIVAAIIVAVLAIKHRYRWMTYLMFTAGVGSLLIVELKVFFARARPDLAAALRRAHGYSFPSGHAMGSTIVCGALGYLAYRALPTIKLKAAALALASTFILAVATSRVYLGVHWISDVGAGITAGFLWVSGTTVAYETFRRIRLIRALRLRRPSAPIPQ